MRAMQENVNRLDGQLALVRAKKKQTRKDKAIDRAGSLQATASRPVVTKLPELPVVRLNAQNPGDTQSPVLIKLGPSSDLPVDHSVLKKKDPVLSRSKKSASKKSKKAQKNTSFVAEYDAALSMLRNKRDPHRAQKMFERLQTKHPKSQLTDNIAYWLAECHFVAGDETAAIDSFLSVAESYPQSAKAAYALLRVAQVWQKRGNTKQADEVYTKITNKYPSSDAAPIAQSALASNEKKVKQ